MIARCEHCKGSGLADKEGPDDDYLLSRVVLSAVAIDRLREINAELLEALKECASHAGGDIGDIDWDMVRAAIAKAESHHD